MKSKRHSIITLLIILLLTSGISAKSLPANYLDTNVDDLKNLIPIISEKTDNLKESSTIKKTPIIINSSSAFFWDSNIQHYYAPKADKPTINTLKRSFAVDYDAAQIASADYLRRMQADITEDNAGNGNASIPDDDPDDAGWDWTTTIFTHSPNASPTNLYGVAALGAYYTYLETGDAALFTVMQDVADHAVSTGPSVIRSAADMKFLMLFNDLYSTEVTATTVYSDAAKAKYDERIVSNGGTATSLAEYIRDLRGVTQGYQNGIIAWDIGIYSVVAQMLFDRYGATYNIDADDIAEVLWQDSYNSNPGYFDIIADAGYDPTYTDNNFWWYTLGITGLINAFNASGTHTTEIPDLVARIQASQYPNGAISSGYGANSGDDSYQTTAYAMMALGSLDQTTYQTDINSMGEWLGNTQDTSGGWLFTSGEHIPVIGGECTSGLYYTLSSPGDLVDFDAVQVAGANYVRKMQADISEDNAGNGTMDDPDDPDDGGWDWVTSTFSHGTSNSPTNIYGATVLGVYYTYLETGDAALFTVMQDAADHIVSTGPSINRSATDMLFLMHFNNLYSTEVSSTTVYSDAAKSKYDQRLADNGGTATSFVEYIRDVRGVTQNYKNGIIAWDIGFYSVVAQMLFDVYGGTYDVDADDIAEVLWQDSYNNNPGYFDVVADAGWDPTYTDNNFWWYTLGITGLIDAFNASGNHADEIPGLVARLQASQYPSGAISYCYGANLDDEDWQSTAYSMMSLGVLDQATHQAEINSMGDWVVGTQDVSGGWVYTSGDHYPQTGGQLTAGLYYTLNSCCINFRGNVDNDPLDEIDISDLVVLVAYAFGSGSAPTCMEEADIDGSGGSAPVDISDIVLLVAYMFQNGAAPANCP